MLAARCFAEFLSALDSLQVKAGTPFAKKLNGNRGFQQQTLSDLHMREDAFEPAAAQKVG